MKRYDVRIRCWESGYVRVISVEAADRFKAWSLAAEQGKVESEVSDDNPFAAWM